MSKKLKCKKCGTSHDSSIQICPVCGEELEGKTSEKIKDTSKGEESEGFYAKLEQVDSASTTNSTDSEQLVGEYMNPVKKYFVDLIKFPSREIKVSLLKSVLLFAIGFLGTYVLSFIISIFLVILNVDTNLIYVDPNAEELVLTTSVSAALNFGIYFILFGIFLLIFCKNILPLVEDFAKGKNWLQGLYYGVLLIIFTMIVNLIFYSFSQDAGDNENEQAVNSIVTLYPFLSIIVFGIIGPICEEITYRIGLFSGVKKLGRVPAYIICTIIFGLIHFSFDFSDKNQVINELINLPSYMVAGALLCYFYEKKGISASIIAHCTNNLFSVIITILSSSLLTA